MAAHQVMVCILCLAFWMPAFTQAKDDPTRTSQGKPNLAGVWDYRSLVPLERPEELTQRENLTPNEATQRAAEALRTTTEQDEPSDPDRSAPPKGRDVGAYNNFWFDNTAGVIKDLRTSLITDPPNGRLPAHRAGVDIQALGDIRADNVAARLRVGGLGTAGPEQRGIAERCLLGFSSGPPILPGGYNQNIRISQTADHVVILNEMVHDARIVPLNGLPKLGVRAWMGESRGQWEGETLVVETTNFNPKLSSFSASFFSSAGTAEHLRVIERFQRLDENTLRYEFTVDDPATYTAPITGMLLMQRTQSRIYEYACHEGNYAMRNILSGARAEERLTKQASSLQ
jgi:hypothetical protein